MHCHSILLLAVASGLRAAAAAPNVVDCAFREMAVKMASRNLGGDAGKLATVSTGLNASDCPGGGLWAGRYATATPTSGVKPPAGVEVYVSPAGNDGGDGTERNPLRTLRAAKAHVRALVATKPTAAVEVNLLPGTYYESLVLGPEDSGSTGAAVTWQGPAPGTGTAALSGGDLISCTWKPSRINGGKTGAFSCVLPMGHPNFQSLFYNGARLQRARFPNGDPAIPCNDPATCTAAGYTAAGQGNCLPDASAVGNVGPVAKVYHGDRLLTSGVVGLDPGKATETVVLNVTDSPFVHDAGAFTDYTAYQGGGVKCYNASYNLPFWNSGSCNCDGFTLGAAAAARAAVWKTPSTGVVHMFHSVRWGGWAFDVDGYTPGPPSPPTPPQPPPPGPGWGQLVDCTSCLPHDEPIKQIGKGGTLAACQAACEADSSCTDINFAADSDQNCYLFSACSKPSSVKSDCHKEGDWWSWMHYQRPSGSRRTDAAADAAAQPEVDAAAAPGQFLAITGGQQTGQQGSTRIRGNDYFVENIKEELDVPGEFFWDSNASILYVIPPAGQPAPAKSTLVAAVRPRILQLRGASDSEFAHDIAIRNLGFLHSAPTFMADYEMPSGGDWSIHRGGAVFLDGTEDIVIDAVDIDQAGGNGIFLSNHAWRTTISGSTISHAGDSGIVLAGSTQLMNGTKNTYPAYTNITGNLVFENGFYGKQTASYFKSISYKTNLVNNVFFNSPRSLVNYNDAFRGGDLMMGNVMWGAVKETADHASFNSWDRQAWFWEDADGVAHVKPEMQLIQKNLILNKDFQYGSTNSDWAIDHDDASSWFEDSKNVMVYGSHKWRDGVHKWYTDNLYVTPEDATANAQWGIGWYCLNTNSSKFANNTMVNWAAKPKFHYVWSNPMPDYDFQIEDNKYFTPGATSLPFHVAGGAGMNPDHKGPSIEPNKIATLAQWQAMTGNDAGSTISADMDLPRVVQQAEAHLF